MLSPDHLINTFADKNEELLKSVSCKDDNNHEEVAPGIDDQNAHSVCKDLDNVTINLDDRSTSKDMSEIYNQMGQRFISMFNGFVWEIICFCMQHYHAQIEMHSFKLIKNFCRNQNSRFHNKILIQH